MILIAVIPTIAAIIVAIQTGTKILLGSSELKDALNAITVVGIS